MLGGVCGYVGWQARIVRERKAFRDNPDNWCRIGVWRQDAPGAQNISWLRRQLGDEAVGKIGLPLTTDIAERQRVARLFPEAEILACPEVHFNPKLRLNPSGGVDFITEPLIKFPDESADQSRH
jgi:hypothetical protein